MREFRITDLLDRFGYKLNGETGFYLINPTGLGTALSPSMYSMGSGFYGAYNTDQIPQGNIVGDILITPYGGDDAYQEYTEFVSYLMAQNDANELYFCYKPSTVEYMCKVRLESITKTEKEADHQHELLCPISLQMLTPWYTATPTSITPVEQAGISGWIGADIPLPTLTSHIPAAWEIKAEYVGGDYNGLTVECYGNITGKLYGKLNLLDTVADENSITIFSKYENPLVAKNYTPASYTDLNNNVDISTNPFFKVPLTEQCYLRVSVGATSAGTLKASCTVYQYYRSV